MAEADPNRRDAIGVKNMFARVAPVYDTVNRAMCFGLDILWRRKLARALSSSPDGEGLIFADIACGSGDVCIEIARRFPKAKIVGLDFCGPMLELAKKKAEKFGANAGFAEADCENLPFPDNAFDGATIAFGFRNFRDRPACLREIARVLKSGARLAVLEVAKAPRITRAAQNFFMRKFVPTAAAVLGGNKKDYEYLAETTMSYPSAAEIEKMFADAGFENAKTRPFAFGLVAITSGEKKGV